MKKQELNLSLNSYLLRLRAIELEKPASKRRRVPTITDFAKNAHFLALKTRVYSKCSH